MLNSLFNLLDRLYLKLGRAFGRELRVRGAIEARACEAPQLVAPPTGRVLVIAPHPDDEAIGCGGTLLLAARAGAQVGCLLMTGGEAGRPDWERTEVTRTRCAEMEACARRLGIVEVIYLPGVDGCLAVQQALADELRAALERFRPDAIFLPFFMDAHPDHRQANALFLAAAGTLDPATPVWGCEIWSAAPANAAIDISAVVEEKAAAIRLHASQDTRMNYSTAALGLNAWRALQVNWRANPALTHAEAFTRLPLREYRALAEAWLRRSAAG